MEVLSELGRLFVESELIVWERRGRWLFVLFHWRDMKFAFGGRTGSL